MADNEDAPPPGNLRTGYTTGACATAATKAAALALKEGRAPREVTTRLPAGIDVTFQVVRCDLGDGWAEAEVIKDAGDDPDCTHGAHICSRVSWSTQPGIDLRGGKGVGKITKPGLGLEVGGPAINPVPRRTITEAVAEALPGETRGVVVEIIVPGGEEMAKKTLNARLGIVGGISILGTTGIVKPFSTAAYKASIEQAIDVAVENGCRAVVLTTGGRSERFAQAIYADLKEEAFVQMGDFVGFSLDACVARTIRDIRLCGMPGKMTKIAQGRMQTHAAGSEVDVDLLADIAAECGGSAEMVAEIRGSETARRAMELVQEERIGGFFDKICRLVVENCARHLNGAARVSCLLTDFEGNRLGGYEQ